MNSYKLRPFLCETTSSLEEVVKTLFVYLLEQQNKTRDHSIIVDHPTMIDQFYMGHLLTSYNIQIHNGDIILSNSRNTINCVDLFPQFAIFSRKLSMNHTFSSINSKLENQQNKCNYQNNHTNHTNQHTQSISNNFLLPLEAYLCLQNNKPDGKNKDQTHN